jgi:predicted O-linked N-acetylglucosamine transferase (SPINDLY family)
MGDEKIKRLRWFGSLEKDEFLNLVSISDVCLDPFPFGGCNTSFDAFDYNIPVITMPSEFLHGRFTYGLYRKMGLDECIVSTTEEYAQLASRIGINEKLRHKINRNIEMKKNMVFQEQASIDEWNGLFENLKDCI